MSRAGRSEAETVLRQVLEERTRRRIKALEAVRKAHKELQQAKQNYAEAVMEASAYGATNVAIAKQVGLTETAIRLYIKRRGGRQ